MKKVRNRKWKILFLVFLFVAIFVLSVQSIHHFHIQSTSKEFLKYVLADSNHFLEPVKKDFSYYLIKYALKIDLKNPVSVFQHSYQGPVSTTSDEVVMNTPTSSYVEDPYPEKQDKKPLVYIYNTHQLEEYSTANIEEYGVVPNVMMASYILRERLLDEGVSAIVEDNDVNAFLQTNNWNYASSYKVTRLLMEDAKSKNPSLKYYIDLHRDSVGKNISTAKIGDKSYARILFIVGLENEGYEENLKVTQTIFDMLEHDYPGITRTVYKKQGKGVNGVYNQDFDKNVIIVEMGGSENTLDEVLNSVLAFSKVLSKYIEGEEKYEEQ